MKTRVFLTIGMIAVIFQGCIIKSLHPFYKPEEVIFREGFLDGWKDQDLKWQEKLFIFHNMTAKVAGALTPIYRCLL